MDGHKNPLAGKLTSLNRQEQVIEELREMTRAPTRLIDVEHKSSGVSREFCNLWLTTQTRNYNNYRQPNLLPLELLQRDLPKSTCEQSYFNSTETSSLYHYLHPLCHRSMLRY